MGSFSPPSQCKLSCYVGLSSQLIEKPLFFLLFYLVIVPPPHNSGFVSCARMRPQVARRST